MTEKTEVVTVPLDLLREAIVALTIYSPVREALNALIASRQSLPQAGECVVPREPTDEMVRAGAIGICTSARGLAHDTYDDQDSVWSTWRRDARYAYEAMIAAAPLTASPAKDDASPAKSTAAEGAAVEALRATSEALAALLRQTNNIEVLGEWEAVDINRSLRKTTRARVDAVIERARAALTKAAAALKEHGNG
jgi:hypothetical protein